jgi:hypothetical protein
VAAEHVVGRAAAGEHVEGSCCSPWDFPFTTKPDFLSLILLSRTLMMLNGER